METRGSSTNGAGTGHSHAKNKSSHVSYILHGN